MECDGQALPAYTEGWLRRASHTLRYFVRSSILYERIVNSGIPEGLSIVQAKASLSSFICAAARNAIKSFLRVLSERCYLKYSHVNQFFLELRCIVPPAMLSAIASNALLLTMEL